MPWAAVTTGGPEIPLWLWVFVPFGAVALGALFSALPLRKYLEGRRKHERRVERVCEVVLGEDADPVVGRYERIPGLVDVVADIQKAIGDRNGKPLMEHIDDIERFIGMKK